MSASAWLGTGKASVRQRRVLSGLFALSLPLFQASAVFAQQLPGLPVTTAPSELRHGRELLQTKDFLHAKQVFQVYLGAHPDNVQGELGLGDAELGLRQYEAAEMTYRSVVAQQPELWQAHKNLVVVEAALGRWEEFDRERTVLRLARERGAPDISPHESDVIDSFSGGGEHWVVRAYFQPMGRSEALYNFEQFSPAGRVAAYLSLEDAAAARAALKPGDVRIGSFVEPAGKSPLQPKAYALNWYTGSAHGTVQTYNAGIPSYERVRADVFRWLKTQPAVLRTGPARKP
ncbi:MAG: tetratricopeptide repeat protein [Janthinobacterium lividum]